ncbi:hypothetical protein ERJ75_001645300 [Trypanosoma vivax]|uniref:Uncharacterized protein n=1 Tax=Trypanosoma vivax (strain Y486) TaxID=1055687 RepID=G0U986_TRYVY|nr:hypothetical protein TRVL_04838 [Trypanosoma vivax]KAH8604923.1 hypothetical protein ERJ75_001645300 [Trypanosoma vivax]CCC54171.1 conserved hypothetical protein [Trypanosoma vivax Y486]
MVLEAPANLLQLLADYTSQALDAIQGVSDEFEEDVDELRQRTRRISGILKLIRECEHERTFSRQTRTAAAPLVTPCPARIALQGLAQMVLELTGVQPERSFYGAQNEEETTRHGFKYGLLRIGKPVSLAEASLEVLGLNTRVSLRRTAKHSRDTGSCDQSACHSTIFSSIAATQRKRRFALYTARTALLPKAFLPPKPTEKVGEMQQIPFISPAILDFAALNVEAECAMLASFCMVDTKAQLMREWPSLKATVVQLQESLLAEGVTYNVVGRAAAEGQTGSTPWFEFPFVERGVIRVIVRRSLALDLTWDSLHGGRWRVLAFHWLMRAQPAPSLLQPESPGHSQEDARSRPLRVQPAYDGATMRYLTRCFEAGLESGCMGALRVVNAVAMEVIEAQCKTLREAFFVGPLETSFSMDVRPGTHVSITLSLPQSSLFTGAHSSCSGSRAGGASGSPIYLKYKLCMGTVVVERRCGTDTQSTVQSDFYVDALQDGRGEETTVVNVEHQLWNVVST